MSDASDFKLDGKRSQAGREFDFGLLANFVHQVINPLSGTSGHLSNLIDGTVPENRQKQRLAAARAQVEHSISLMRNLAYFSQVSLDPNNTNPGAIRKVCVVPQVIIEAIQFYQEIANSRKIAVELLNPSDQYRVIGNPDLLRQVFMNIIDNAVKYANPGTKVTFRARPQKRTSFLFVEIESLGTLIAHDELAHIFDLGFRGSAATKKVASGTGLGLNICQTIIKGVYKGSIVAESSRTGKTKFTIKFPEFSEE